MSYEDLLKYPLKIMENVYAQKVVIYSMGALFILNTAIQNLNLFNPGLFDPVITGCEDYKIEYTRAYIIYSWLKIPLYDLLTLTSFAWFLNKYKFCAFTLTAFYGFVLSMVAWSVLMIIGVDEFIVDVATTGILNFAWLTYIIYKLNRV